MYNYIHEKSLAFRDIYETFGEIHPMYTIA